MANTALEITYVGQDVIWCKQGFAAFYYFNVAKLSDKLSDTLIFKDCRLTVLCLIILIMWNIETVFKCFKTTKQLSIQYVFTYING